MFGKKPYEMLSNTDIETLVENVNKTKNVEWDEYDIQGEKVNFPMWKVVTASQGDSFEDFKKMFTGTATKPSASRIEIDSSNVGVVKASDAFTKQTSTGTLAYGDDNLIDKVSKLMTGKNTLNDQTGIVKPQTTFNSGTVKQIITVDASSVTAPVIEKAGSAPKAKPGVVKPTDAMIKQNVSAPKATAPKGKGVVGVVKPKVDMGKQNVTKPTETNPKGKGVVGVVKPKSDLQSQGVTRINFDKYITDSITKA